MRSRPSMICTENRSPFLRHAADRLAVLQRDDDRLVAVEEVFRRAADRAARSRRARARRRCATGRDRAGRPCRSRDGSRRTARGTPVRRSARCRATASVAVGAAIVFKYARIFQISSSAVRGPTDGISVPGTPRRSVRNRPPSVRPDAQTWVRSGPRTPRASMPWQSAQRERNMPMPA